MVNSEPYTSFKLSLYIIMEARNIAQTILTQLTYGQANKVRTMSWGMNTLQFGVDKKENLGFLRFKVQGYKFKGIVKISLEFNDTYKVEFIKMKRKKNEELSELYGRTKYDTTAEVEHTMEMVYCDELNEKIDNYVEKQNNYTF